MYKFLIIVLVCLFYFITNVQCKDELNLSPKCKLVYDHAKKSCFDWSKLAWNINNVHNDVRHYCCAHWDWVDCIINIAGNSTLNCTETENTGIKMDLFFNDIIPNCYYYPFKSCDCRQTPDCDKSHGGGGSQTSYLNYVLYMLVGYVLIDYGSKYV
ncbi:uncharacterized protein LOC128951774 [Oppia nitens]|uniref:uncharacterized protein LOC128951774 n=1 Tax=Oppia nitens TaxID=1686743 RepID=UPI0023DC9EE2|nr:uncharacterized protein LOC128951774 [Oppia nitens]